MHSAQFIFFSDHCVGGNPAIFSIFRPSRKESLKSPLVILSFFNKNIKLLPCSDFFHKKYKFYKYEDSLCKKYFAIKNTFFLDAFILSHYFGNQKTHSNYHTLTKVHSKT